MAIPETYNLTLMGNTTGMVDLIQLVNKELMFGWFGTLLLIAFFVILMMAFIFATNHAGKSFATASFLTMIISILFRILGLVPDLLMYGMIAIAAFSVAFIKQGD